MDSPETEAATQPALTASLDQLWTKFLPLMIERTVILDTAAAAFAADALSLAQRAEANAAAHKLAGVLGAFGLVQGTDIAREAENLYSREPAPAPDAAIRLKAIAAQLRDMVESRK